MPKQQPLVPLKFRVADNSAANSLSANAVVKLSHDLSVPTEGFYLNSLHGNYVLTSNAANAVWVGITDTALSSAEVLEALLADPVHPNDAPAIEEARRRVRIIGAIISNGSTEWGQIGLGEPVVTPVRWKLPEDSGGYQLFLYNPDDSVLGSAVELTAYGTAWIRWL